MAVTAKADAPGPVDPCVRICVADKTTGARIGMPVAADIGHESALMCPRVSVPDAVRIKMAGEARGVCSLCIMARSAAFDIAVSQPCVKPTARADTDCHKTRLLMGQRPELKLIHITAGYMAC